MPVRLGLRENAAQFSLLVVLNALVGSLVGLERSVLAPFGQREFALASNAAVLSFIVAFGASKALANLLTGPLAGYGRKRVLVAGWVLALPAPLLVGVATSWTEVVAANVFLGASQGLAWSMTVLMKIDLVGPKRRGFALGLNEAAGYLGVAVTAAATGWLAGSIAPRTLVWSVGAAVTLLGLGLTLALVRETLPHVRHEQDTQVFVPPRGPGRGACFQAGFVNNLNDAVAWGLVPVYLAAHGVSHGRIGAVAGVYPAVWGVGQLGTGALSDRAGRRPLILAGMLVQGAGLLLIVAGGGRFGPTVAAAAVLGLGTALVYPTLLAAVSDSVAPAGRARANGLYRFWRDSGLVAGALLAGFGADALGSRSTIAVVAMLTVASGVPFAFSGRESSSQRLNLQTTTERRA
jgi:MFS family permease